ncbi:MAG: glutaredoxin family protein [bacterium]
MRTLLSRRERKIKVDIYSKKDCHLCEAAKDVLLKVQKEFPFDLEEIDITQADALYQQYKEQIPVIFINGRKAFKFRVGEEALRRKLKMEMSRG